MYTYAHVHARIYMLPTHICTHIHDMYMCI